MEKKNYRVLRKAKRTPERIAEDKAKYISDRETEKFKAYNAKKKIYRAQYYQENKIEERKASKKHDLGYFAVYAIDDYIGTGDAYCGQTGNLYNRMGSHKRCGRLNTDTHRVLGCFRTREQALAFEAIQHKSGYHGYNNGQ